MPEAPEDEEPSVDEAIRLEAVSKRFGTRHAVRALDLRVPRGALYGFIGPNGAGKTTTIRIIMGILFPDQGRVSVLGCASAAQAKARIGYLPEERGVYRKMRVGSFLAYMARLKGAQGGPALRRRVREWLARLDLGDVERKRCEELSKGMQQKVQFLATVLHEPELLILDEPFSGLDPVNMRLMRDLFLEQHRAGRTIIFSTHVMHQAEELCDHVVMINRGTKVLDAPLHKVLNTHDASVLVVEPMPDADIAALTGVPGVGEVRQAERAWEVQAEPGTDARTLMTRVIESVPIRAVSIKRPTLEDVFVGLVRSDAEPAVAGSGTA